MTEMRQFRGKLHGSIRLARVPIAPLCFCRVAALVLPLAAMLCEPQANAGLWLAGGLCEPRQLRLYTSSLQEATRTDETN